MVVLVSFLLVLAAAVTLVVGLLQSGLTLIYLSIGCSVVAGLVLAVAVLRGRPEPKAAPYVAPPRPVSTAPSVPSYSRSFEPEPELESADEPWKVEPAPAARRFGRPAAIAIEEPEEEPEPAPIAGYARRAAGRGAGTGSIDLTSEMPTPVSRGAFPIAGYESLRAPELLRKVDELGDVASLEEVRGAEAAGKNRVSVLARIDARLETLREPGWDIDEAAWEGAEEPAAEADLDEGDDDLDEGAGDGFPIDNYDSLRVGQILPMLPRARRRRPRRRPPVRAGGQEPVRHPRPHRLPLRRRRPCRPRGGTRRAGSRGRGVVGDRGRGGGSQGQAGQEGLSGAQVHGVVSDGLPLLVYDGDCGFCTRTVELALRMKVACRAVPWQQADLAALGLTEAEVTEKVWWVDPGPEARR